MRLEIKKRKHIGNFSDEGKNHDLQLFVVDYALSTIKEDESEIWFVD